MDYIVGIGGHVLGVPLHPPLGVRKLFYSLPNTSQNDPIFPRIYFSWDFGPQGPKSKMAAKSLIWSH